MRNRTDFLQGLVAGIFASLGIALLLRTDAIRSMLAVPKRPFERRPYEWDAEYPHRAASPLLRRERPERGGNPASLSPEKSTHATTSFERPSGAPGSPAGPEHIAIPGRLGETADLSDPSRGVRPAGRAIHVPDKEG
jgi:hypothetical protein